MARHAATPLQGRLLQSLAFLGHFPRFWKLFRIHFTSHVAAGELDFLSNELRDKRISFRDWPKAAYPLQRTCLRQQTSHPSPSWSCSSRLSSRRSLSLELDQRAAELSLTSLSAKTQPPSLRAKENPKEAFAFITLPLPYAPWYGQCVERERRQAKTLADVVSTKYSIPTIWFEAATAFPRTQLTQQWRIKVSLQSNLLLAMCFSIDRIRSIFDWADGKGLNVYSFLSPCFGSRFGETSRQKLADPILWQGGWSKRWCSNMQVAQQVANFPPNAFLCLPNKDEAEKMRATRQLTLITAKRLQEHRRQCTDRKYGEAFTPARPFNSTLDVGRCLIDDLLNILLCMQMCRCRIMICLDNRVEVCLELSNESVKLLMASNATSRIENQDGTCLVQTMLSHTCLPWSFCNCTVKHKITLLAFFLKNERSVKATSSDSALVFLNRSLWHWFHLRFPRLSGDFFLARVPSPPSSHWSIHKKRRE